MEKIFRIVGWTFAAFVFIIVGFAVYEGLTGEVTAASAPKVEYNISITSDPPGASIFLDGATYTSLTTPAEIKLALGEHNYRVAFENYKDESNLYKPYSGRLNVTKNDGISVWLDRFSAEEVARKEQAKRAKAEAAYAATKARIEAERAYYRIDTDCSSGANLTYFNADGNITQQSNQGNSWYYYFVPGRGQYLSLSAQNQCDYGSITVKIMQGDTVLEENTSNGAYVIASVSGTWE